MKYFKPEYNWPYAAETEELRQEYERKGEVAREEYHQYFQSIVEPKLSKNFVNLYYKHDGFHDARVPQIVFEYERIKQCNISIHLKLDGKPYVVKYRGVQSYNFQMPDLDHWFAGDVWWTYAELEILGNGSWNHRILFETNIELDIVCKRFSIQKEKN